MSGSASLGLEQAILGHTLAYSPMAFPAQVYVALDLAPPATPPSEAAPGTEVAGIGYTRRPATFALIATPANIAANTTSVEFPMSGSAWGTVGYFELWDAPVGGNRLYWGQLIDPMTELPTAITVAAGDILRLGPGALGVQAATGPAGTSSVGAYLPLGGGTMTGPITLAADPTLSLQAATKQYVDAHSGTGGGAGFLPISGGALTGSLTLVGDAASALQPVTLQQMQTTMNTGPWLPLAGGTVTGLLQALYLHATSFGGYAAQGAYLMWSRSGDGLTDFVNNRGSGEGGFAFVDSDGTTDTLMLTLRRDTGATFSLPLSLPGSPTSALQAATKQYVDGNALPVAGGTITGNLIVSGATRLNQVGFYNTPSVALQSVTGSRGGNAALASLLAALAATGLIANGTSA